tara:strand:- start:121 stop:414 length:294 start_codon:yes stop_codon:yes gene_type:complete
MSLFKSISELAKATTQLVKEDKQFRKDVLLSPVHIPIAAHKIFFDKLDEATGSKRACKNVAYKMVDVVVQNELRQKAESMCPGVKFDEDVRFTEVKA